MKHVWLALLFVPALAAAEPRQWILVTPPSYRAALEPLCQHRRSQGFQVTVVEPTEILSVDDIHRGNASKLEEHIHKLCREFPGTSRVLLAGAVGRGMDDDEKCVVPALRGTVGRMKGEPSDCGYGCPQAGRLPSVAVGRFPARTQTEAAAMVRKTLEFERDRRPGRWRRQLTVLAGVPAFNPIVDRLVERLALSRLERIDPSWTGRAIYHSAESCYCVPDADLHARAVSYVSRGQALTLYLGHSSPEGFWANDAHFLDRDDWSKLRIDRGSGIFATFGCTGCQLRGRNGEGYGVAAARNPHGPAAVLGAHGICFAAMVKLASEGFVDSFLRESPPEELGTCWLALLDGLANGKIDALSFSLLDAVDGDARISQATQRQEHLEMFVLLGDPALRLPVLPGDLGLQSGPARPGAQLRVSGTMPPRLAGARVHVTLERTAGSLPPDLQPLPKQPGPDRDRVMVANQERANRFVIAEADVIAADTAFSALLAVPEQLSTRQLILRAYAADERNEAQGVLRLNVER